MNKGLKIGIISIVVIIILIITYFLLKKSGVIKGKDDDCCLFDKNNVCIAKRGDAKCEATSLKK